MSRPKTRDAYVHPDTIRQIKNLFGSVRNAHRLLGLQLDVEYTSFYRAMQYLPVTAVHAQAITLRWSRWREIFLHPACATHDEMSLNPMDHTLEPEWRETPSVSPTRSGRASSGSSPRRSSRSSPG